MVDNVSGALSALGLLAIIGVIGLSIYFYFKRNSGGE